MEERRDPGVQEPQEEKDYAFMQEVIKDENGSRKFKRDVRRMAGLGLVFGLVACVTFCAFGPWIESRFGGAKEEVERRFRRKRPGSRIRRKTAIGRCSTL